MLGPYEATPSSECFVNSRESLHTWGSKRALGVSTRKDPRPPLPPHTRLDGRQPHDGQRGWPCAPPHHGKLPSLTRDPGLTARWTLSRSQLLFGTAPTLTSTGPCRHVLAVPRRPRGLEEGTSTAAIGQGRVRAGRGEGRKGWAPRHQHSRSPQLGSA